MRLHQLFKFPELTNVLFVLLATGFEKEKKLNKAI